jgi:hypothetical protein
MAERKYAMIRLRAGDYLLPSNDLTTMYRVSSYEEDGSLKYVGKDGKWHKDTGTYWGVVQMTMSKLEALANSSVTDDEDILDWNEWESYGSGYGSRKAAIEDALS